MFKFVINNELKVPNMNSETKEFISQYKERIRQKEELIL